MAKWGRGPSFTVAILGAALLAGCGGGSSTIAANNGSAARRSGSLEYALTTTKMTFARGEPVPLKFNVKNFGPKTVNVELGPCDWFDTKLTSGSNVVWQKSVGSGCIAIVKPLSIAPGETKTFSYDWPQTDQQSNQVVAGSYTVKAWFQAANATDPTLSIGNQEANEYANSIQITVL